MKKSTLFLFELVFIAISFLICATICIRIFAFSYTMSFESRDLAQAVTIAQSAAARFQSGEYTEIEPDGQFSVKLTETAEGTLNYGTITVFKDDKEIYSLKVAALPEVFE